MTGPVDDSSPSGARVLVVEDSAVEAMLLERALTEFGYAVIGPFATGEEAIAAARRERPDLILMDVALTGRLSGIEAAEQIVAERPSLVVFLTAYGDLQMKERMQRIAGSAVLGKPFSERILELTLRQLLNDRARLSPPTSSPQPDHQQTVRSQKSP